MAATSKVKISQPRYSELNLQELDLAHPDYQQDSSTMEGGVPVMKIGLNEPDKKSVVMSRTEFSQVDITGENSDAKQTTSKRKKKAKKARTTP